MRIGIGVTTYKRPECLAKWKEQMEKHNDFVHKYDYTFYIAEDTDCDRKGVAARKNECLRALKDCDHIFLFDDDCYPIKDGWVDFFINSGENHLLFLSDKAHFRNNVYKTEKAVVVTYMNCGGVFMYMSKKAVEMVGAFNEEYLGWGFEHADYSVRILNDRHNYPCLAGTEKFLYSEDYSNPLHKSSIDAVEKQIFFEANFSRWKEGIKQTYIPL